MGCLVGVINFDAVCHLFSSQELIVVCVVCVCVWCVSGYDNCRSSDNFWSTLAIVRAIMPLSGHRVRLNVARSTRNNR